MSQQQTVQILPMRSEHVPEVARLHIEEIGEGFISSLGDKFVRWLYQAIVESGKAFGFVAVEDGRIIGFITCVESVTSIYKYILRNHFFKLVLAILPKLLRLSNVKDVIETLFYPIGAGKDLNCAEIVAIVIDGRWRGKGVGRSLIQKAVDETGWRGMEKIKVMVGEPLSANEFYKHLGFELVGQYRQHGHLANYYMKATADN